jgi:serine/threonine protein kinase
MKNSIGVKFNSEKDVVYLEKHGKKNIGSGSFGDVKLIHHVSDPKTKYALKIMPILDEIEMKYIMQEIQLHQKLNSPYIIKLVDYFIQNEKAYVILEYAPKGDLFRYLHRTSFIKRNELYRIFLQVLKAFQYLHAQNILHRDLKPENILLDAEKNAKVCDFGWSTSYSDSENRETICGTAEYMAPEVLYHQKQTKATDVWALGKNVFDFCIV